MEYFAELSLLLVATILGVNSEFFKNARFGKAALFPVEVTESKAHFQRFIVDVTAMDARS
jgi:hypothetical protein